jgi:hypothetical protein
MSTLPKRLSQATIIDTVIHVNRMATRLEQNLGSALVGGDEEMWRGLFLGLLSLAFLIRDLFLLWKKGGW